LRNWEFNLLFVNFYRDGITTCADIAVLNTHICAGVRNNPICVWRVSWSPYGQIPNCQIAENTSNHQEGISGQASGSAHGETSHNHRKLTYSRLNNIKKITCPRRILVECLSTQKKSDKNPNYKNILIHELTLNQQSAY
jgi:hypothetical protein